ncbi:SET domain-containing protein 4, variant 3 [Balamuthia mandrillaris]
MVAQHRHQFVSSLSFLMLSINFMPLSFVCCRLKENGMDVGKYKLEVADFGSAGRGLVATEDIAAGETLVSVPSRLLMNSRSARRSLLGEVLVRKPSPMTVTNKRGGAHQQPPLVMPPMHTLVLFLLWERHLGTRSFWHPFIQQLPTSFTTSLYFTNEELQECQSDKFVEEVNRHKTELARMHEDLQAFLQTHKTFFERQEQTANSSSPSPSSYSSSFCTNGISLEDIYWAVSVVNTRACYMDVDTNDTNTLVPFADFLNHNNNVQSVGEFRKESDEYRIVTRTPFKKGEQVFICYGKHGNTQLLHLYGFVLNDNQEDVYTFDDPLQWLCSSSIPLKEEKDTALTDAGLLFGEFYVWPSGEVSWNLLTVLRVYFLTAREFTIERKHQRLMAGEEENEGNGLQLQDAQAKTNRFLCRLAELLLGKDVFTTSYEEDVKLLSLLESRQRDRKANEREAGGNKKEKKGKTTCDKREKNEETGGGGEAEWKKLCAVLLRMGEKRTLLNMRQRYSTSH